LSTESLSGEGMGEGGVWGIGSGRKQVANG
jgi:hypothetical protein